jgi:hypothetical protein
VAERASQNQECQENKSSGAEERTKDACKPPKTAPLSPLKLPTPPAHPATADQSDAVLHNLPLETVSQGMPGREGSRCLTRQEQVASYSRALVMTAATATTPRAAVLLRRMSLSRSRVFPGVCTKAHEGVCQGAPRGGAHTSPPMICLRMGR